MTIDKLIRRNDTPLDRNDRKTKLITQAFDYLAQLPGNNSSIRTKFIIAFNDLYFGITNDKLIQAINEVTDVLHQCSLLIDDVEDSSEYRRGAVAAHLKFGVPSTINCVSYMYFVVMKQAQSLSKLYTGDVHEQERLNKQVEQVLVEEMLNLHHGQGVEIYWRDNKSSLESFPTEEEYLEMAMDKTSGLLRIIVRLLDVFKPCKSDNYVPLVNILGIIYQLRDDYFNLTSDKYSHSKGVSSEDLIEGKFSFPILHSLKYAQESPVKTLLYTKTHDERKQAHTEIEQAVDFITNTSQSLQYTKSKIKHFFMVAKDLIEKDPYTQQKQSIYQILDQLDDT